MYRFLLSRQWLSLTLVALVLIPVMVRLGFWQLHRHEQKVARNGQIAQSLAAPAVPVGRLTSPSRAVPDRDRYRTVTAAGSYDTAHEVVVRRRTAADGSTIGYHVLTSLVLSDGTAVLVNRGWVAPGADLTVYPDVPDAPTGRVTVTGLLLPDETTAESGIKDRSGLPERQIMLISSEQLSESLDLPLRAGYIQLSKTSPEPAAGRQPELLPEPDHSSIGPHLAYAFNWWLLAAGVPVGWVILVRRERRDRLAEQTAAGQEALGEKDGDALALTSPEQAD